MAAGCGLRVNANIDKEFNDRKERFVYEDLDNSVKKVLSTESFANKDGLLDLDEYISLKSSVGAQSSLNQEADEAFKAYLEKEYSGSLEACLLCNSSYFKDFLRNFEWLKDKSRNFMKETLLKVFKELKDKNEPIMKGKFNPWNLFEIKPCQLSNDFLEVFADKMHTSVDRVQKYAAEQDDASSNLVFDGNLSKAFDFEYKKQKAGFKGEKDRFLNEIAALRNGQKFLSDDSPVEASDADTGVDLD